MHIIIHLEGPRDGSIILFIDIAVVTQEDTILALHIK